MFMPQKKFSSVRSMQNFKRLLLQKLYLFHRKEFSNFRTHGKRSKNFAKKKKKKLW